MRSTPVKIHGQHLNTNRTNCVPPAAAVLELLHCPINSPQTSQIQFLKEASTGQCVGEIP